MKYFAVYCPKKNNNDLNLQDPFEVSLTIGTTKCIIYYVKLTDGFDKNEFKKNLPKEAIFGDFVLFSQENIQKNTKSIIKSIEAAIEGDVIDMSEFENTNLNNISFLIRVYDAVQKDMMIEYLKIKVPKKKEKIDFYISKNIIEVLEEDDDSLICKYILRRTNNAKKLPPNPDDHTYTEEKQMKHEKELSEEYLDDEDDDFIDTTPLRTKPVDKIDQYSLDEFSKFIYKIFMEDKIHDIYNSDSVFSITATGSSSSIFCSVSLNLLQKNSRHYFIKGKSSIDHFFNETPHFGNINRKCYLELSNIVSSPVGPNIYCVIVYGKYYVNRMWLDFIRTLSLHKTNILNDNVCFF